MPFYQTRQCPNKPTPDRQKFITTFDTFLNNQLTEEERKNAEYLRKKRWRDNNNAKYRQSMRETYERRQYTADGFITDLKRRIHSSATNRGHKNTLTREDIEQLVIESNGKCAISGMQMTTLHNDPNKASVDRIDSKKGYVKGNVRLVTTRANYIKKQWGDDDILEFCLAVVKHNGYKVKK